MIAGLVDFAIVVNVVFCVVVRPESPVAVTSAVYVREFCNGRVGTQPDPSSRGSAGTCVPLSSVSRTAVTFPPVTAVPTSALIGTSRVRSAGVSVTVGAGAACSVGRLRRRLLVGGAPAEDQWCGCDGHRQ